MSPDEIASPAVSDEQLPTAAEKLAAEIRDSETPKRGRMKALAVTAMTSIATATDKRQSLCCRRHPHPQQRLPADLSAGWVDAGERHQLRLFALLSPTSHT